MDIQTGWIILTNIVVGVAVIVTMKNDIHHLKKSDDKQEERLGNVEKIVASHETRLTVQEQSGNG
jgi:hypothetical protein